MPLGETIVSLATPEGESALAVIRLSGPECCALAQASLGHRHPLRPRRAEYRPYHSLTGEVLDHVVAVLYHDDKSYTGEPMLEICTHGNPLIVQRLVVDLRERGCRLAEPGEFTRTAFVNGKIDLSQAEAVADLIAARSERGLELAHRQLSGELGRKVDVYLDRLLRCQAAIEAYIDFPEEDLPPEDEEGPLRELARLSYEFAELIASARFTAVLRDGVSTVIAGAPNAGKSSLLNALVGDERAIVSPEPGTTRDFISERIMVGPHTLRITDTAGIHDLATGVESLGIRKSLERIAEADILLLVIDSAAPSPTLPSVLEQYLKAGKVIVLENKADLAESRALPDFLPNYPHLRLSAKTGEGLEGFREAITRHLEAHAITPSASALVINARHATAFAAARRSLDAAREGLQTGAPVEIAASELRLALESLGEVVGKIDNEAMLDRLFATFCIGK